MHVLLYSVPTTLKQAPAKPHLHWRLVDTPGQVWVSLLWGHYSFLLGPGAHKVLLCPPRVYFPVLCKFWWLYGGVNSNLLQVGLCHIHVCCTQSPFPCGSPLLTCTSAGDAQTQFCLSLSGVPGSWCTQGWFEPSEHLWQEWSLILNMNLFAPPIILLGLLLCPWTQGVSSKRLQHCTAAAPAFLTLYRRQESRPSPRKRNAKKQNGCLRRPYK